MDRSSSLTRGAARLIAAALASSVAADARAQTAPPPSALPPAPPPILLEDDPQLAALVADSLAARPELGAAAAGVQARRPKVALAGAWPDPVLTLGVQNDGFTSIEIGAMETSFASIMVTQAIPWPGKRRLRTALAEVGVGQSHHGDLGHPGVAEQHRLDLTGTHPVPAGLDQVHRLAPDDAVHTVGVDDRGVTGAVPAVGLVCLRGGIRPVEVAVEHRRGRNLKAANGFPVMRHRGAVVVPQPRPHTPQW